MANQAEIAKEKFGGGLLFLPQVERGRDPVTERELRSVVAEADWGRQRWAWEHYVT